MKFVVLFLILSLSLVFHLCSCDNDEISNEVLTQAQRRPSPGGGRRSPPPPRPHPRPPPPSIPPCPPSKRPPGFDHFVFTLTWPNAFCKTPFVACRPSPPPQYFTIHGLWPVSKFHNSVTDCIEEDGRQLTEHILDARKSKLLHYWPRLFDAENFKTSKKFWRDQWCKHGSCSSKAFTPANYFDKALALGSKYSPLFMKRLQANGIKANGEAYSWVKIVEAIEGNPRDVNVRLSCEEDPSSNNKLRLTEIQMCVNSNAVTPKKDCGRKTTIQCQKDLVFASPPITSLLETPIFEPSILEVLEEEAAGLY